MRCRKLSIPCSCSLVLLMIGSQVSAQRDGFERPPIDYLNTEVHDPVAVLASQVQAGQAVLEYDQTFGYLRSVLKALGVSVNSQTLVFSKTSLQLQRISPSRPRALYFNDDVYLGYCQKGDVLEFAATDAKQGATFYTLEQTDDGKPRIIRDRGVCLSCHASGRTQNVPGYLVRSVFTEVTGQPKLGFKSYTSDHKSDLKERWGGWYVTGHHGSMRHMGNTLCTGSEDDFDHEVGANQIDLTSRFPCDTYLSAHSDIVALMVLEHQTQMHNAIAAANYETRQSLYQSGEMNAILDRPRDYISDSARRRIASSTDRVLKYLLMCGEFQLTDSVSGSTSFAQEFTARGKKDSRGRSLRDFDLKTRLFKYPCSYLIDSAAFEGLPAEVRLDVVSRLKAILDGRDTSPEYAHLSRETRTEILEILSETKPELHWSNLALN